MKNAPMTAVQHKSEIIKLLRSASYRHDLYRVFSDAVEMLALAISNRVDRRQYEEREAQYLAIAKRYQRDELTEIAHILPHLTMAFEDSFGDHLGEIFMMLDLGNEARGQFFTPYDVSTLMAQFTFDDSVEQRIADHGFITISEPTVGSGGMVVAVADYLKNRGICYQRHCHVMCMDVDIKAVHMAYIQLSLIGMPAVVVQGNTLTLEEQSHWYTPAHILGGWNMKLRNRDHIRDTAQMIEPPRLIDADQMELFA